MTRPTFQDLQLRFAAHLRDPDNVAAPDGIEDRRLAIYRRLVFNNVRNFMLRGFPVLRRTIGEEVLTRLVRQWLREHRARTPLFPRLSSEFVAWVAGTPEAIADLPPWVPELAHYEWVETELTLTDQAPSAGGPRGTLTMSPLARALAYGWPVHRIRPGFLPDAPEATFLLVHRDASDKVRFHEITAMTFSLLHTLATTGPQPAQELLARLNVDPAHAAAAQGLVDDLITKEVLLCTP